MASDQDDAGAPMCAQIGADLVLAARSAERLDDVAKQIIDTGRRAACTDTGFDDDDVSNLAGQCRAVTARPTC